MHTQKQCGRSVTPADWDQDGDPDVVEVASGAPEVKVYVNQRLGADTGAMLAISLHAVRDELRNELVPLNKKYPIRELLQACREYPGATELFLDLGNRRIDFAAHDFLGPNYLIKTGKATDLVVLSDVIATVTQSAAVSAKNKPLADRMDALFADWRKDGTLEKLAQKWFGASIDWSKAN